MLSFNIDFDKAYRQARTMQQCADDMQQQAGRVNDALAQLRPSWRGVVSAAYVRKLEAFASELRSDAGRCRNDANAFRARIDAIREAEEAARRALEEQME